MKTFDLLEFLNRILENCVVRDLRAAVKKMEISTQHKIRQSPIDSYNKKGVRRIQIESSVTKNMRITLNNKSVYKY